MHLKGQLSPLCHCLIKQSYIEKFCLYANLLQFLSKGYLMLLR